jgi:purine-binding chemotaxis protein CheW
MSAVADSIPVKARRDAERVATEVPSASLQCLSFSLGCEFFAVDITAVREIVQTASITAVPLMPDCIRGVTNLRGAVVPVMDLQARFGRGVSEVGRKSCVLILDLMLPVNPGLDQTGERQLLGVMVDSVSAVLRVPVHQIEQAPRFGLGLRPELVAGISQHQGRSLVLLHLENTFHLPELYESSDPKPMHDTPGVQPHASH